MILPFATLDAFTVTRYLGNPVAIVRLTPEQARELSQEQKQNIAREFNLSEIVFLHLPAEGVESKERKIDIFTSYAEVPFAGHPTIGTGNYLLNITNQDITTLHTKAGPIPISKSPTGGVQAEIPHAFHKHQNTVFSVLNGTQNPIVSIVKGMSFVYVSVPSLAVLAEVNLNVPEKANVNGHTYDTQRLDEGWKVGLVATLYYCYQGTDEHGREKYRTRHSGTREDPGTGSASSGLACFLALKGQETSFAFQQGVEMGRPNDISVRVTKNAEGGVEKVVLSGQAVKVMEGELEI